MAGRGQRAEEARMQPTHARRARLILASQSARRRQLLSEAGLEHRAMHPGLDDAELEPGRVSPGQWVAALAYLKAAAGFLALQRETPGGSAMVLGADTACVKDGDLIGTPTSAGEAESMLRRLQDGRHDVVTGVALIVQDEPFARPRRLMFADASHVTVGHIGDDRIREYIRSEEWKGKAGGYNLLERIGAGWPITYVGDPTTVMGLPMRALLKHLDALEHAP
jgi:septum formation protein